MTSRPRGSPCSRPSPATSCSRRCTQPTPRPALHRFLDMGIEPFLIAPSVLAVVGQRLVRRICRECRVAVRAAGRRGRVLRADRRLAQDALLPRRGLQLLLRHGLPGTHRRVRGAPHDRRDASAGRRRTRATPRCGNWRSTRACAPARRGAATRRPGHHDDLRRSSAACIRCRGERTRAGARAGHGEVQVCGRHRRGPEHQRNGRGGSRQRRPGRCWRTRASMHCQVKEKPSLLKIEIAPKKVKRVEIMNFSRQLAAFVRAGIPILDAIDTLRAEAGNDRFRGVLAEITESLRPARRCRTRSLRTPTCSRPSTRRSCARPSSPATSIPCSTSSRRTSSATRSPAGRSSRR